MARTIAETILVVEDDANIGTLVRTYLMRDGYDVLWLRTGEAALAELPRHRITLVVLDIGLPGIDGLEVCRRIGGRVPVVMLSARDRGGARPRPDRPAAPHLARAPGRRGGGGRWGARGARRRPARLPGGERAPGAAGPGRCCARAGRASRGD